MKCPACGTETSGAFCSECGTPLKGARCRECEAPLVAGAQFCNNCGAAVKQGGGAAGKLPWIIAGGALTVLLVFMLVPSLRRGGSEAAAGDAGAVAPGSAPMAAEGAGGPGGGTPPPLTGTPREQADRLFNRIMQLNESGDTARAKFFTPMGMQAYENAAPLDDDGLYHLSLIQIVAGDGAGARKTAEQILAKSPNHLLALNSAAQGATMEGDKAAAKLYFQRFLKAYPTEKSNKLPEYEEHANVLPVYESAAQAGIK